MSDDTRGPVLIGYDGHEEAAAAIRGAGRLLAPRRATVAYVRKAADESRAGEVSEQGARLASDAGFDAEALAVRGRPKAWPALLELADRQGSAAIVVGSEGLGAVKSALAGSVSSGLVHHSGRPLLIVPQGAAEDAGGPVILAYDGSEDAVRAIASAADLLGKREVIVQTVWTSYRATVSPGDVGIPAAGAAAGSERLDEELAARAQRTAEEGAAAAARAGMRASAEAVVEQGSIYRTLLDSARDRDAEAVVVGSRGQSAIRAALIGSVAMGLVHHAHVPLLVVPPPR
jgi:nucleotide-binding universal stress UspA family protein